MRLMSCSEVIARTGLPRSTWYAIRARGEFPRPLKVCDTRLACWLESDVDTWLRQRGLERRDA